MDSKLADEVVLRIFSFLDAPDLVRLQLVNTHICHLAKDRQLWKTLFYFHFVRPAHASSKWRATSSALPTLRELRSLLLHQNVLSSKHITGDGARPIHRLPSRYYRFAPPRDAVVAPEQEIDQALSSLFHQGLHDRGVSTKDHLIDWEHVFRVSTNWQRGNFAVSELLASAPQDCLKPQHLSSPTAHHTIVRVSHRFILTATAADAEHSPSAPSISVYPSDPLATSFDQHGHTASHIPTDLHERSPILQFSSPGLQRWLERRPGDQTSKQVHVTEIAVDADVGTGTTADDASEHRKRKLNGPKDTVPGPVARVLVAYSTGHFSLFSLRTAEGGIFKCKEDIFHSPKTIGSGDHVAMAALHSSALVLCSSNFDLAFYRLSTTPTIKLDLIHRLSSFRCSWPASLRLKKLPYHDVFKRARRPSSSLAADRPHVDDRIEEEAFRVTLAYSTPSYPSSWSVSVQEIVVRLNLDSSTSRPVQVTSRHATAKHPFRPTPIDPRGPSMLGRHHSSSKFTVRPHDATHQKSPLASMADATNSRSTSLTHDDPFVVLGASDNLVEVYELLGATTFVRRTSRDSQTPVSVSRSATATPSSPSQGLRLVHRRSLHGHTGSVHSVALEDGRCVSGGADGSVMVWSLGDRANETDSIASAMRHVRATARGSERKDAAKGVGARSTSSTIMEEAEGDDAATHMSHVLTLRSPMELDRSVAVNSSDRHASYSRTQHARSLGPSLGELVRSRVLDRQARGVIRWVSTAFDKIVSIVAYTDALPSSSSSSVTASHCSNEAQQPRERVQVWSFG